MLYIPKTLSIPVIEELYGKLKSKGKPLKINLPPNIKLNEFFIIPAFIQFIATWQRSDSADSLIIDIDGDDNESLQSFVQLDYGFPSVILCWQKGVCDSKNKDLKPKLRELNVNIHKRMARFDGLRQDSLLISCFDHLPPEKGLLSCFYQKHKELKGEEDLLFYTYKAFAHVIKTVSYRVIGNIDEYKADLNAILFELFQNTHEHARVDEMLNQLNPNIRGVYFKLHKGSIENFKNKADNSSKKFIRYFEHDSFQKNGINSSYFLEISVFDSGPGFIKRNLGLFQKEAIELDIDEKVEIIKFCLSPRGTSTSNHKSRSKGRGLPRTIKTITNKGLIWIRTDNLSLVRDMKSNPFVDEESGLTLSFSHRDIQIDDFTAIQGYNNYFQTEGSIISILLPIELKNE